MAGTLMSKAGGRPVRPVFRVALFVLIAAVQFVLFEAALRTWGGSEAAPAFQGLFEDDPGIGYRLKPHASTHFKTLDFEADIRINEVGVRDDDPIGPKPPNERRVVLLGDSLVLSIQVPFNQTFGELLERRLNDRDSQAHYRVINVGVQGYGPVEERLLFEDLAPVLEPDVVVVVVFVGNDAEEAARSAPRLDPTSQNTATSTRDTFMTHLRRLVRRTMVLQVLRLRMVAAAERFTIRLAPPEPPLQSYLADPAPRIAQGIDVTRRCVDDIAAIASRTGARTAIALMPARFQVDDPDYGRLKEAVAQAGGELIRDAATRRFEVGLSTTQLPMQDLLPPLRHALPGPDLFYQTTVHLTPRGHRVVAEALATFLEESHLVSSAAGTR